MQLILFIQGTNTGQAEVAARRGPGMTGILVLSVAAAVIGSSTQFGYNTGVINSPKQVDLTLDDCKLSSYNIIVWQMCRQSMIHSTAMSLISMLTSHLLR